jgi:hypothetical protein
LVFFRIGTSKGRPAAAAEDVISWCIRVIRKVRKTQHQNPEFGHTQGEILKKPAQKYISIQWGMKLRKPSILVVN